MWAAGADALSVIDAGNAKLGCLAADELVPQLLIAAGADLFELFLQSGVFLDYAEQYLDETQIDSVDIATYLEP